jgi:hypothetical protein
MTQLHLSLGSKAIHHKRAPKGWRYFFAQASLPLPRNDKR